jgi:hypothetical protein
MTTKRGGFGAVGVIIGLVLAVLFLSFCEPARADEATPAKSEWSNFAFLNAKSDYNFMDFVIPASTDPVVQAGWTFTHESGFYIEPWISLGSGGAATEFDLTIGYNEKIGPFNCGFVAAYYALNLPKMSHMRDDIVDLHVDCEYPLTIGKVAVNPYGRYTELVSLGTTPGDSMPRIGLRPSFAVGKVFDHDLKFKLDTGYVFHLKDDHYEAWRNTAGFHLALTDSVSVKLEGEYAVGDGREVKALVVGLGVAF